MSVFSAKRDESKSWAVSFLTRIQVNCKHRSYYNHTSPDASNFINQNLTTTPANGLSHIFDKNLQYVKNFDQSFNPDTAISGLTFVL